MGAFWLAVELNTHFSLPISWIRRNHEFYGPVPITDHLLALNRDHQQSSRTGRDVTRRNKRAGHPWRKVEEIRHRHPHDAPQMGTALPRTYVPESARTD